jgi:hypothetical protein
MIFRRLALLVPVLFSIILLAEPVRAGGYGGGQGFRPLVAPQVGTDCYNGCQQGAALETGGDCYQGQQQVIQQQVYQQQRVLRERVVQPIVQQPVYQQPILRERVVQPVYQQPVYQQPVLRERVVQPIVAQPVYQQRAVAVRVQSYAAPALRLQSADCLTAPAGQQINVNTGRQGLLQGLFHRRQQGAAVQVNNY